MHFFKVGLAILLISGSFSCSSDNNNSPPEVVIEDLAKEISPPQLYQNNQKIGNGTELTSKERTLLSIYSQFEFDSPNIASSSYQTLCLQDGKNFTNRGNLDSQSFYPIYQILSSEIIKNLSNATIHCDISFTLTNYALKEKSFTYKDLQIATGDWQPTFEIFLPFDKNAISDYQMISLNEVKNLTWSLQENRNASSLSLNCLRNDEYFSKSPILDAYSFDWYKWMLLNKKTDSHWTQKTCRWLIYSGNQIIHWSRFFKIISTNPVVEITKMSIQRKGNGLPFLKFKLKNKSNSHLVVSISKRELKKYVKVKEIFHLYRSRLLATKTYQHFENSPYLWASAKNLSYVTLHSSKPKDIKQNSEYYYLKVKPKSKNDFWLKLNRVSKCKDIVVEKTLLKFNIDGLSAFYSHRQGSPIINEVFIDRYSSLEFQKSGTKNRRVANDRFFYNGPKYQSGVADIADLNSTSLKQAKSNFIKNFDCSPQPNTYYFSEKR